MSTASTNTTAASPASSAADASSVRMSPRETLTPGTTSCGFTVERTETISELDATLRAAPRGIRRASALPRMRRREQSLRHRFKTPPANSTGVFHILEHSVLCGSAKFPVKEPFVDLIKSSMQTFLNAMTYPDKTIYPLRPQTSKTC